ncbi:MAG TPA: flavin prenyltransferase UbiX [Acidobacteriota bacterium]|nr:flavin prenyltransferase UbiX [Acidobacteriota bacterium]
MGNFSTLPIVLAVTGASGAIYPLRTARALLESGRRLEVIISPMGRAVMTEELGSEFDRAAGFRGWLGGKLGREITEDEVVEYDHMDLAAPPSSGSHKTGGMVIAPCSMKTLAAVSHGLSRNLIERAADVTLKERRPLVLVPRECPLSLVHLRNMTAAGEAGAVIAPASPAFYQHPETFNDLADFIAGRVLSILGIPHNLFASWGDSAE